MILKCMGTEGENVGGKKERGKEGSRDGEDPKCQNRTERLEN